MLLTVGSDSSNLKLLKNRYCDDALRKRKIHNFPINEWDNFTVSQTTWCSRFACFMWSNRDFSFSIKCFTASTFFVLGFTSLSSSSICSTKACRSHNTWQPIYQISLPYTMYALCLMVCALSTAMSLNILWKVRAITSTIQMHKSIENTSGKQASR